MVPHLLPPSARRRSSRTNFRIASRRRYASTSITIKRKVCRHQWSDIDCHILERVQRKLLHFADALQCRAVCSHWRSVTQSYISSSLNSPAAQLPPLLWSGPHLFIDVSSPVQYFYHLNSRSRRFIEHQLGSCVGFSHGWFLFLDKRKVNTLYLFHPLLFSATALRFPPLVTPEGFLPILSPIRHFWISIKVVLWADPILSEGNYGIAVIHSCYRKILFAKSGATQFTGLEHQDFKRNARSEMKDIICFQNRIYGVAHHHGQHRMEAWDCTSPYASPTKVLDFQPTFSSGNGLSSTSTLHLVESQGELLLVSIQRPKQKKINRLYYQRGMYAQTIFSYVRSPDIVRVYKMDFQQRKWVRMDSLGDCALFIMGNRNLSVSTIEFPQFKRNTVYFKHEIYAEFPVRCIGVFNMEDASMKELWPQWY